MAKMPSRFIKLLKLTDGNVHTFEDDGCSPTGEPNGLRQQLIQALAKTVIEKDERGQTVVDDESVPRELGLYRLAEIPARMRWDDRDEKQIQCARNDHFDRDLLKRDGDWIEPSPRWLRAHEVFKDKRAELHADAEQRASDLTNQEAGRALGALLELGKQRASDARDAGTVPASAISGQDPTSPPPAPGTLAATGIAGTGAMPLIETPQHITTPDVSAAAVTPGEPLVPDATATVDAGTDDGKGNRGKRK